MIGVSPLFIKLTAPCARSEKVAAKVAKASGSTSEKAENFLVPWSIDSFKKACRF